MFQLTPKNPFILGQTVKSQGHEGQKPCRAGVGCCTLVSAGFLYYEQLRLRFWPSGSVV